MKDDKLQWVGQITDAVTNSRQSERDRVQRTEAMALIDDKLLQSESAEQVRGAFASVQVELASGKNMPLLDIENHDPLAEIDTYHDMPGSKGISSDQKELLHIEFEKIMVVKRELAEMEYYKIDLDKAPFVDAEGNSIYDPDLPTHEQQAMIDLKNKRMAEDLWQPLMREGVIPENMIPDKYSEVVKTFAGASEAYEASLQEHSRNMSDADIFLEKFQPVKDIGGHVIKAAGSVASFAGTAADLAGKSEVVASIEEASEIIGLIDVAFTATCDIVPLVVKDRDGIKVMDVFNDALESVLKGAGVADETASLIHGLINGATRAASAGVELAKGNFEAAFQQFGEAIASSFGATQDDTLAEIGNQICFAVARMGAAAKVAKALSKKPPEPGTAINVMMGEISVFVKSPEIKLVVKLLGEGAEALQGAVVERDAFKVTDFMGAAVAEALEAAGVDADIAFAVNNSISGAISGAKIGTKLADGDYTGAFEDIGAAINTNLGKIGNSDLEAIGGLIESNIQTAVAGSKFLDAMRADPPNLGAAEAELNKALQSALGSTRSNIEALAGEVDPSDADAALTKTLAKLDEVVKSDAAAAADEMITLAGDGASAITKEQLDALKAAKEASDEAAARSEEERLRAFMAEDDAHFNELLITGMSPADGDASEIARAEERRLKSIETMIAIVQRDKKMFELAQKICTKGPQLLADMVPGMGLASACAEMAFKIAEAVKHAEQLIIWTENTEAASKAATVQLDAMMNRYGLEKRHVLRGRIEIGIQAVKIAGEATKLSPAAPIGLAISSGAAATSATFAAAWAVQDYADFVKAWNTYKKALENPQDRKAARMAMRRNATLSKYAMAYGALHDGNAIAREAMRKCNITEATLAQPETNVDKLVEYLEALYSDDPVIVKAVPMKNDWHPGEVELSYKSFCRFVLKAMTEASPKLGNNDVSAIKGCLSDADTAYFELTRLRGLAEPGAAVDEAVERAAIDSVGALARALKAYTPMDEAGERHVEMGKYIDSMTAMAQLRWREVQKIAKAEQKKRAH